MMTSTLRRGLLTLSMLAFFQTADASSTHTPWYVSADLGTFQGNYDLIYNDKSDIIAQNFRQPVQQYGYTGGLALGYSKPLCEKYLLGAEVSANLATNTANFASGASSSSFSDQIKILSYVDAVIVPGLFLSPTIAAYAKAGLSGAYVKDYLSSPSGSEAIDTNRRSDRFLPGLALGLGLKKFLTEQVVIFGEYQYHDYLNLTLPNFQNYSATYSHSVNIYSQAITLGLSYFF